MASRPKSNLTVEQYLAAYEGAAGRYELVDGVVVKMAAETSEHVKFKGNVYFALRNAVAKAGLQGDVFTDGMAVRINPSKAREPDASVQCGKSTDPKSMVLDKPVILVEVTSPSSGRIDEEEKLVEYFSLPSVEHYLIINPAARYALHLKRIAGEKILTTIVRSGQIEFEPPGISISFDEIFGASV
jgi:Uma2 family endonuclease